MADFLLTVHVLAAILWVGGSWMLLVFSYAQRGDTIERRNDFTRFTEKLGPRYFAPLSIIVVLAGSLLVDEAGYDYSHTWVTLGYVGWFLSFLIGVGFYPREGKRREELIEREGLEAPGVAASLSRILTAATVDTVIITLVVIDMTTKPGL